MSRDPPTELLTDVKEEMLALEPRRKRPCGPDRCDDSYDGKGYPDLCDVGERAESKLSIDLLGAGEDMVQLAAAPFDVLDTCGYAKLSRD